MAEGDPSYFYAPQAFHVGRAVELSAEEAEHAHKSLRLGPGAELILVDGRGSRARAVVEHAGRRLFSARIRSVEPVERPAATELWLASALVKGPRFDTVVEKAGELGVHTLVPLVTQHTVGAGAGAEKRSRWERIAVAAMKQSQQAWLTDLAPVTAFGDLFPGPGYDTIWAAHRAPPSARPPAAAAPKGRALLLVGPEGGWSSGELADLARRGAAFISLGDNRLRADTAAIALVAVARAALGEFGAGIENATPQATA